jgi:hypothetical protein
MENQVVTALNNPSGQLMNFVFSGRLMTPRPSSWGALKMNIPE